MEGFRHLLLLLVMAGLLFFVRLGNPLLEPEEARYAEIPRQMLAEGRFLLPVLHDETYLHKPPLLYWLVMACYRLLGVHDWVGRVVPAGAGVLIVLVTFAWARATVGKWAALASGVILVLTPKFVYQARMLTLDGLLCLWIVAGWAACHCALQKNRFGWGWWLLGGLCCGLGLLTQARIPWLAWPAFLGVALMAAGPWYMALMLQDPQAAADFFWLHNIQRFVDPFDHIKPFWYYGPIIVVGMLPWTGLLVPLVPFLFRQGSRPSALYFYLLCLVWCVTFFSMSGCKRPGYILPAFPALALVLGTFASCRREEAAQPFPRKWSWAVGVVFLIFLGSGYLVLPDYHRWFGLRGQVRRHLEMVHKENLQVACFPRRWDSVSFYLEHADVKAFGPEELPSLLRFLDEKRTLLFVKKEKCLEDLLLNLPASLEVICLPRESSKVFVALVQPKIRPLFENSFNNSLQAVHEKSAR
jgi:4-amino-4-deoxy-L-arabinose transferase-like glycosyltransferase